MTTMLRLVLTAVLVGFTSAGAEAQEEGSSLRFRFRLDNDYSTSAGAFDASGTLVRTLWSNRRYAAGTHEAAWDGLDDDGRTVDGAAQYEIRVLTHNVIYTWEGTAGNTSPDATSPFHHDGPYFFTDLVISGDRAFFTTLAEGPVPTMRYFLLDSPQFWRARPALPMAYGATMGLIAADRERVYWAHDSSTWPHTWGKGGDQAFLVATDREISREVVFEAGKPTCVQLIGQRCYRDGEADQNIRSAIDIVRDFPEDPATSVLESRRNDVTGLAVQNDGPLLFVAHGNLSPARIHVLDKRSGRELARVPLPGVGRLLAGPGRDDLWAIHERGSSRVVSHLRVGPAPDYPLQLLRTLTGIEAPIALALAPDGKQIVVADAGASQQLKAFDVRSGEALWQAGKKGGYAANGPAVGGDKFSFYRYDVNSRTAGRFEQTVLGFAPDGSFWVGDTGLSRLLKFDTQRRPVDQIAFLPINYNVAVDRNDPSRVFARYMEYAIDYTKPIGQGWRPVRYFGDGPQIAASYHGFDAGFVDVCTLGNGRTYGLLRARSGIDVIEIPAEGDLRRLPPRLKPPVFMNSAGDLYAARSGAGGSARVDFWRRRLTGFDAGVPTWAREESTARVVRNVRDPRVNPYGEAHVLQRSAADLGPELHILFDPANSEADGERGGQFHLAAIQSGAPRWLWRASPATGPFDLAQPDGVFDISRPTYPGMAVTAIGDQIVYNYHGEGWRSEGQANQFLHWYRNGLFVGQFGVPNERAMPPAAPGLAGNSLSIQLVEANGATYLWHSDEHAHDGLHRWRIDGVEWIRELTATGRLGREVELARASPRQVLAHEHDAPTGLQAQQHAGRIRLTWKNTAGHATGIEIQRLQPTYVGPRFERIAVLPADAATFVDAEPLSGEATVYRARAMFADGASDYSGHVHIRARAKQVVLESQSFESTPPDLRNEFHPAPTPDIEVSVVADPDRTENHVLRIRARKPPGPQELRARVRWKGSARLFRALNASMGRPRGSRPDLYRVSFRLRLLEARLGTRSEVSLQVDPGYNLFSTSGRRQSLPDLAAGQADLAKSRFVSVSFNFAALPNGAGTGGLQQYRNRAPGDIAIAFPITLRADGDAVEFLVDDLSVARLDAETEGPA